MRKSLDDIFANKPRKSLDDIFSTNSQPEFVPDRETLDNIRANNKSYEDKYNNMGVLDKLKSGASNMGSNDLLDIAKTSRLGAEKVIDGTSLGAYGWANRKLGGNYTEREKDFYKEADDAGVSKIASRGATLVPEISSNIVGIGGAIVKNLSKAGLKGLKLLTATGGVEGIGYGATRSDTLKEMPINMIGDGLKGAIFSNVGGRVLNKAGDVVGGIAKRLPKVGAGKDRAIIENLRKELGDEVVSKYLNEAKKTGRSLLEIADDDLINIAQRTKLQSPDARKTLMGAMEDISAKQPEKTRSVIDNALGSKTRGQNIDDILEKYSNKVKPLYDDLAKTGDLTKRYDFGHEIENYRPILKSIRRNMQKNDPSFRMAVKDGKIDYDHFLKDSTRRQYIGTLPSTLKNPNNVLNTKHNDLERQYFLREYMNPEKNTKVYDMGIKSDDGVLINKIAREGSKGKREFDKLLKNASDQQTPVATSQMNIRDVPNSSASTDNISKIEEIVNRDFIKDVIGRVKKDPLSGADLKSLPDTDFKVLDMAKRNIDDMIDTAKRAGENNRVRLLQDQKNQLVEAIDGIVPEYKMARNLASERFKLEEAQNISKNIFTNRVSPEDFKKSVSNMSAAEKESLAIGLRNEITDRLGSRVNEATSFSQFMPQNVQDKLKYTLGDKKAKDLIEYAKSEVTRNRNFNTLRSGSQTAEKSLLANQESRIIRMLKNPLSAPAEIVEGSYDILSKNARNQKANRLAELLGNKDISSINNTLNKIRMLENNRASRLLRNPAFAPSIYESHKNN